MTRALLTLALWTFGVVMFFVATWDVHLPLAVTALCGFVIGVVSQLAARALVD